MGRFVSNEWIFFEFGDFKGVWYVNCLSFCVFLICLLVFFRGLGNMLVWSMIKSLGEIGVNVWRGRYLVLMIFCVFVFSVEVLGFLNIVYVLLVRINLLLFFVGVRIVM